MILKYIYNFSRIISHLTHNILVRIQDTKEEKTQDNIICLYITNNIHR